MKPIRHLLAASLALASGDGEISLWDVASRQEVGLLLGKHDREIHCLAYSPDGTLLASAGNGGGAAFRLTLPTLIDDDVPSARDAFAS